MKILLYSEDLILLENWKQKINSSDAIIIDDIEKLSKYQNNILVLDYSCCYKGITNIIQKTKQLNIKILLLDSIPSFEKGKNVLTLGVKGYGNILLSAVYLNSAIETLQNNMIWMYPEFTTSLIQGLNHQEFIPELINKNLTSRELDTALLIKDGLSNTEISEHLDISINTVKSHIKNIYEKLNVKNRLSLSLLFTTKQ